MILKPLPPWQQPLVKDDRTAQQQFFDWLKSVDALLRGVPPNVQAASYVLTLNDAFGIVETNVAGANTLTVPPSASVAFPLSTRITVIQINAGQTTLTPGAGVNLQGRLGLKLAGFLAVANLYKLAADFWVAGGDLVP